MARRKRQNRFLRDSRRRAVKGAAEGEKKQLMQMMLSRNYQNPASHRRWILALVLVAPFLFSGCPKNDKLDEPRVGKSTTSHPPTPLPPIPGAVAFNGERAMDHVKKQMEIGPRPPGSPE